jgi:hypothetical protein
MSDRFEDLPTEIQKPWVAGSERARQMRRTTVDVAERKIAMDPDTLRGEIMRRAGAHEATGSSSYLEDKEIATAINVPLADVQRQIRILESRGLLDLAAAFGPSYGVRLTPQGELALEQASEPGHPNNLFGF